MFDDEDGGAKSCEVFWCCMLNMQSCLHGSQGSDEDFISKILHIKLHTSQEGGGGPLFISLIVTITAITDYRLWSKGR